MNTFFDGIDPNEMLQKALFYLYLHNLIIIWIHTIYTCLLPQGLLPQDHFKYSAVPL